MALGCTFATLRPITKNFTDYLPLLWSEFVPTTTPKVFQVSLVSIILTFTMYVCYIHHVYLLIAFNTNAVESQCIPTV